MPPKSRSSSRRTTTDRASPAACSDTLGRIAQERGVSRFVAEVRPRNTAMLRVFAASGWPMTTRREDEVVHITLAIGEAAAREGEPHTSTPRKKITRKLPHR
jgi:hypothetical protein